MGSQGEPGRQVCRQPSEQADSGKGQHSKAGRGPTVANLSSSKNIDYLDCTTVECVG